MGTRLHVKTGKEISNPRTGQRMVFTRTRDDTSGEELIIECWSPPNPPAEPHEPLHVHPRQEKRFVVVDGELTMIYGGKQRVLRAGEEIVVPAGAPHSFWNDSSAEAHYRQEFRPALRSAEFFTTLFALARDGKLNKAGMPSPLQLAATGARFRKEVMVTNPAAPVQQLAFAVLAPVARILGYEAERE